MKTLSIYSQPRDFTEGIYGQCLAWLLEVLYHLEKTDVLDGNIIPLFDIHTLHYGKLIPGCLQPKLKYDSLKEDQVDKVQKISLAKYKIKHSIKGFDIHEDSFTKAHKIFTTYLRFNEDIIQAVDTLNIQDHALGVHYRGTDKNYDKGQSNYITEAEMIRILKDYVDHHQVSQIFCCSDEQSFVQRIQKLFPTQYVEYKQTRSKGKSRQGFFRQGQRSNKARRDHLTRSCMIDMLALSRCKTVIKTSSALSSFSKIINPSLQLYTVSAMKKPYFPAAVANQYSSKNKSIQDILKRTMRGDAYNVKS